MGSITILDIAYHTLLHLIHQHSLSLHHTGKYQVYSECCYHSGDGSP